MNRRTPVILGVTVILLVFPAYAHADFFGDVGVVSSLTLLTPRSDDHNRIRGSVELRTESGTDLYFFSGSSCPGGNITEELYDALIQYSSKQKVQVRPRYKRGQGGAECLVGITAFNTRIRVVN